MNMKFTKEQIDFAMDKICAYYASGKPGHIETGFLRFHGLSAEVDEDRLLEFLKAKDFISYEIEHKSDAHKTIRLTDKGKCYFEDQAEEIAREERAEQRAILRQKKQFAHDWKIAAFSGVVGALLSRPIWSGIDWLIATIKSLF